MSSFAKIASGTLLSLTLATPGCLAGSGDEDAAALEPTDEAASLDTSSSPSSSTSPPCGPGTLIQSLGYGLPPLYGGGYYPGYYGAGFYGGGMYGGYYGGYGPGYYGGGAVYPPAYYNPGYYVPGTTDPTQGCGCPPAQTSSTPNP